MPRPLRGGGLEARVPPRVCRDAAHGWVQGSLRIHYFFSSDLALRQAFILRFCLLITGFGPPLGNCFHGGNMLHWIFSVSTLGAFAPAELLKAKVLHHSAMQSNRASNARNWSYLRKLDRLLPPTCASKVPMAGSGHPLRS